MSESAKHKSSSFTFGLWFCAIIILVSSIVIQISHNPLLNAYKSQNISSTKPYETFEQFYPFYLQEHRQKITRQWHYLGTSLFFLYVLFNPTLLLPLSAGGLAAYAVIPFSRHLSGGLAELIAFASVYFISGKLLTNSYVKLLLPHLFGYGCSWIGHFGFEQNKPAAFIYPTFSFFGDIHMMYDAVMDLF